MKLFMKISAYFAIVLLFSSCYEDYISDYEYTATYFSSQAPLRTIIADGSMDFEVGAALGGMRTDDGSHWVNYKVDTSLLSSVASASGLTALPESYYNLDNATSFNIVGSHMRTVKVTLTNAFTEDSLSIDAAYALPLIITTSSVDTINSNGTDTFSIASANITIVVIKYISPYSGFYYSRGTQVEFDATGAPVDTLDYYDNDLSQNNVVEFTTLATNIVSTSLIGGDIEGSLEFTMNADGTVDITSSDVTIEDGSTVSYDAESTTYTLDILVVKDGTTYQVKEELVLRQAPELDLRFEEWI